MLALQYIGLAVAVLSTPSAVFLDPRSLVLAVGGLGLAFIGLVSEYVKLNADWEGLIIRRLGRADGLTFQGKVPDGSLVVIGDDDVEFNRASSERLCDRMIASGGDEPLVSLRDEPKPLHYLIQEHRTQLLLHSYKEAKARPFNGATISQLSTIESSLDCSPPLLECARSRYFDLLCSNYVATSAVIARDRSRKFPDLTLMLDEQGSVPSIADSRLADCVGVSTLAFDSRRRLILIAQAEGALSSAGLVAPSGSGSLEPSDFRLAGVAHESLSRVLERGMERELCEEANLGPDAILGSEVTGYFRWLTRGAKPEFVGVTFLNRSTDELNRRRRITELRWVKNILIDVLVDFTALQDKPDDPARAVVGKFRDQMSVPLFMSLRCLGERLRDDEFRARFLAATPVS